MGEDLNFDNILNEQDIDTLFSSPDDYAESGDVDSSTAEDSDDAENKDEKQSTDAVAPEDVFGDERQEDVGSEDKKDNKEAEDTTADTDGGLSPNQNFYSSFANALAVDGIFPNLDEETIKKVDSAEGLGDLINAEVDARLDAQQKRVVKALDNNVDMPVIRQFENTLSYIDSITEKQLNAETDEGERIRKNLIFQDFINKGYSKEKANKLTERSIDAGNDIEDAKEALESNRDYFQNEYNKLLAKAEDDAKKEKAAVKKQADELRDSILKDKTLMGDMELSDEMRKKIVDTLSKPVYRNPETGEYLTALQRYETEHHSDFLKYVSAVFTLTNGFTDFTSFAKSTAKKEVKKGLRELERTLNNTSRRSDGSLRMVTKASDDPNSYFGKGLRLDL